ncbi:hypothetical protein MNBD_ALPHA09-2167 [hydrothermal vent metagenome]|uniref:TNase-like domain-containing protein n=1 Tax=hydrothermal vent metagenome TaxID=652676 RepID=A0A3B0T9A5_9ZZZZ
MLRKKIILALGLVIAISPWAAPARGQTPDCKLVTSGTATVTSVIDGDTVGLDDGSQVRLVGTQAPKLPLGRKNFPVWPLAPEAKAGLAELTLGKTVELRYGGLRKDRHGRRLAHLFAGDDQTWVQEEMIARGLARTYSFADNRSCVRRLQKREARARGEELGIWSLDYYALRQASETGELLDLVNSFQLVEGRIAAVAKVRGRVFLNFGKNYRDDFTAVISPGDVRRFANGSIDLMALKGATIRVRGWVERFNGPSIDVTHPEQIEILK